MAYTSIRDMFDGGGAGKSDKTFGGALGGISNAVGLKPLGSGGTGSSSSSFSSPSSSSKPKSKPKSKPAVIATGTGPNQQFVNTATGEQLAAPLYSAFSVKGLTSSDPANVLRNREGTQRAALAAERLGLNVASSGDRSRPEGPPVTPPVIPPPAVGIDSGNLTGDEVSRANAERSRVPTYEAGGYVGPDGVPMRPTTASLDLPPALARMLAMPAQSYAEGGMIGPGGVPQRPMAASPMAMNVAQQGGAPVVGIAPPGQQGRPLNFAAIDQQAQQFMQQNPQQVEQIRAAVQQSIAAGEIDEQSLNMFVQIATTALQNPEMWPQLRQVLIRQGMLDAEDVGEEYDQGFLIILYIIGKTMGSGAQAPQQGMPQQGMPQQGMPMSQGQPPQMSMEEGGALPSKSSNPDGSIPINAHEGEYVIPADVTRRLGTDHFDRLIAKARGMDGKGEQ